MKLITFVVPCYNSEAYMEKCINSILAGGDKVEIIVVNDGSKDQTGEIADAYAARYPQTVKAIHQENGGHGEGINQGVRNATGKYFKVVDSDDWVDHEALCRVLNRLEEAEAEGGLDMMVCNYVYEYDDISNNNTIRYANIFPKNRIIGWEETRPFLPHQYLTLHSCIFRTEVLKNCGSELPKHVFYEDNLYVYQPLPLVKRLCYLDVDLYRYYIGRAGQSVSEANLCKNYKDQIHVTSRIFETYDVDQIKRENKRLGRYMYHEIVLMMCLATAFTRLNQTEETERQLKLMWQELYSKNPRLARRLRYRSIASFVNVPGKVGCKMCCGLYRTAHKIVKFN